MGLTPAKIHLNPLGVSPNHAPSLLALIRRNTLPVFVRDVRRVLASNDAGGDGFALSVCEGHADALT